MPLITNGGESQELIQNSDSKIIFCYIEMMTRTVAAQQLYRFKLGNPHVGLLHALPKMVQEWHIKLGERHSFHRSRRR